MHTKLCNRRFKELHSNQITSFPVHVTHLTRLISFFARNPKHRFALQIALGQRNEWEQCFEHTHRDWTADHAHSLDTAQTLPHPRLTLRGLDKQQVRRSPNRDRPLDKVETS